MDALTFITPLHLAMVPIIMGIVGVFKLFEFFNNKFSALLAVILGLLLSWLIGGSPLVIVVSGLVVGLTGAGLYSGTSATKAALQG